MVYHDENEATKTGVVAKGIISKMHNMAWLKHRITDPDQNVREKGEMLENSKDKKDKRKKKPKGKKVMGNNNQKILNEFLMGGEPSAPSENAWDSRKNVADTLFPTAELVANEEDDMKRAIEESLKLNPMMEKCAIEEIQEEAQELAQKGEKVEESVEMSDEDFFWGKVHKNLPSADDRDICKNFDTNNNSGLDKVKNLGIETKDTERKGRYITARKTNIDEIPKTGNGVHSSIAPAINLIVSYIDQYGRPDGRSETPLFMGKGARLKQKKFIETLQHGKSSTIKTELPSQQQDENNIDPSRSTNKNMTREQTSDNDTQNRRSINYQQQRQSTDHPQERVSMNCPPEKQSPTLPQEKQSLNLSQDKRSMNYQQERQLTNHSQDGRSMNPFQKKQSFNFEENRRSTSYSGPPTQSYFNDKYHYVSAYQKPLRELHDHTHGNRRETHNEKPHREEKFQKPEEPRKIARSAESSTRSSDRVVENLKNEKIKSSEENPKNLSETHENSSEMAISKLLCLADFHSRTNVPIVDENSTSIYPSDVASNSPSSDQGSPASHYSDASANFSQNEEISQNVQLFLAQPSFHCMTQPSPLCAAPSCIHAQESQYASLQLTDPSLHKVFVQKKNRDCCAHRENCSNYENSLIQVDPTEMMECFGEHFPTPEQQVLHYEREMSGKLRGNVCSHVTSYPVRVAHQEISGMMRVDNSVCCLAQQTSDVARENSQMLMQPDYFAPGADPPVHFVPYPNNSQDLQNPYQNVQRSLNLQPIISGCQTHPPGFENIRANDSSLQIRSLARPPPYLPPPFCPSTSGIHENHSQLQIGQKFAHSKPPTSIPKEFIDNHANMRHHFSTSEQPPIIPQRNYGNHGMGGGKNSQSLPNQENVDRNRARNENPSLMLLKKSGGKISHNIPYQENFYSHSARKDSPSMILQRGSNVNISQSFANSPFQNAENQRALNSGRGRGRLDQSH